MYVPSTFIPFCSVWFQSVIYKTSKHILKENFDFWDSHTLTCKDSLNRFEERPKHCILIFLFFPLGRLCTPQIGSEMLNFFCFVDGMKYDEGQHMGCRSTIYSSKLSYMKTLLLFDKLKLYLNEGKKELHKRNTMTEEDNQKQYYWSKIWIAQG